MTQTASSSLSWNPGPPWEGDPAAVAAHIAGPWHIICLQESTAFAEDPSLERMFHVALARHGAVVFNNDTFEADIVTKHVFVLANGCAEWTLEGKLVKGRLRRHWPRMVASSILPS